MQNSDKTPGGTKPVPTVLKCWFRCLLRLGFLGYIVILFSLAAKNSHSSIGISQCIDRAKDESRNIDGVRIIPGRLLSAPGGGFDSILIPQTLANGTDWPSGNATGTPYSWCGFEWDWLVAGMSGKMLSGEDVPLPGPLFYTITSIRAGPVV